MFIGSVDTGVIQAVMWRRRRRLPSTPAADGVEDGSSGSRDLPSWIEYSGGGNDVPLSFLTMHPTWPAASRRRSRRPCRRAAAWRAPSPRSPATAGSATTRAAPRAGALRRPAIDDASDGARDGSRNTAARAVTGRVADASADSSASLALRLRSCGAGPLRTAPAAAHGSVKSSPSRATWWRSPSRDSRRMAAAKCRRSGTPTCGATAAALPRP
uniref:Uncharacterized protein n=1 Tax=Oryza nivara TaxID=4536 RepID=A0A0E0GQ98_ORYNI